MTEDEKKLSSKDDSAVDKATELSSAVQVVAAIVPAVLTGDLVSGLAGAAGVGAVHLIEKYKSKRDRRLDELVQEGLRSMSERIDDSVDKDEFLALYIRARETALKSEREEKLEFIRNFLLNAVIEPTSRVRDKERYLRLLDGFSAPELQVFVAFCKIASTAIGQTLEESLRAPQKAFLMVPAFTREFLGLKPAGPPHPTGADLEEIGMTLRRFESESLLDGTRTGGVGLPYAYSTNVFSARFLTFLIDPAEK